MKLYFIAMLMLVISLSPLWGEMLFTAYPYLAYSKETGAMAGGFAFWKIEDRNPNIPQSSTSILTNALFSQKKQFLIAMIPEYKNEDIGLKISSDIYLKYWPDDFYGTGNFTEADASERFTSKRYAAETGITKDIFKDLQISLRLSQGYHRYTKSIDEGLLENTDLPGKEESFYSGAGLTLEYNTTDSSNYPTRGVNYRIQQIHYKDFLGSDFEYRETKYDMRHYFPLGTKIVLAAQTDLVINSGNVPLYNYLELGNRLRAYDSMRFIDKSRIAQRLEQRVFPWEEGFAKRLGFVIFAESGQVMPDVKDINFKDWHWSAGAGIRFSILPLEKLNLRMDIGFGDDSLNFMINAREVF